MEVPPYLLEDMADDAVAVLDALEWSSAHVIGHSMGAMIAQLLTVRHPERVRSLTCISGSTSAAIGRVRRRTIIRLVLPTPPSFSADRRGRLNRLRRASSVGTV